MKRNALISVYDKSSLKKICSVLNKFNIVNINNLNFLRSICYLKAASQHSCVIVTSLADISDGTKNSGTNDGTSGEGGGGVGLGA